MVYVRPERIAMAAVTTVTARIPLQLHDEAATVASRRRLTMSSLIRRLLEREVIEAASGERIGDVEAGAREELSVKGVSPSETRAAAALNLARRLDTDPTNGAAHARELRALLDDLGGQRLDDRCPLTELQARRVLRLAGYRVVDPDGRVVAEGWTS